MVHARLDTWAREFAISGERLGKWYRLGEYAGGGALLSERLERVLRGQTLRRDRRRIAEAGLWALRDVSFDIRPGESVGLIGRNGAGKTTLLKLLSRITKPTEGRALVRGRSACLLEVGTGFQPDLTGRDNLYLNGAILGMSRREIDRRFDEIVAFAGVERFLDTPVKRYSSGMQIRLAFAVAAHLESDVLFVDEVLAVGDLEFQRKCLSKMQSVTGEGRTVVFVSHNMQAVQQLCPRSLLIDAGTLAMDGPTSQVAAEYRRRVDPQQSGGVSEITDHVERLGTGEVRLRRVVMSALNGRITSEITIGEPFNVTLTFEAFEPVDGIDVEIGISTVDGGRFATAEIIDRDREPIRLETGFQEITVELSLAMLPGDYTLDIGVHSVRAPASLDWVERALNFTVLNLAGPGGEPVRWSEVHGYVRPEARWGAVTPIPVTSLTSAPSTIATVS